jgi:hypothetical protein
MFLTWAHYLYTLVFPVVLCGIVIAWTWRRMTAWPWPVSFYWDSGVSLAIIVSVALYLHAMHRAKRQAEPARRAGRRG